MQRSFEALRTRTDTLRYCSNIEFFSQFKFGNLRKNCTDSEGSISFWFKMYSPSAVALELSGSVLLSVPNLHTCCSSVLEPFPSTNPEIKPVNRTNIYLLTCSWKTNDCGFKPCVCKNA